MKPGASNRIALLIQQATDLTNQHDVVPLIVASISASLYRFEIRKLLLPVAKYMWLNQTQIADFTNSEVTLIGYRKKFVIVADFQDKLLHAP